MESEIKTLRRRILDMKEELILKEYIVGMHSKIRLLERQISELEIDNRRLEDRIKIYNIDETSESDSEYYTADEGPDNIEELCHMYTNKDRTCRYCRKKFCYLCKLQEHFKRINSCAKVYNTK